MIETSVKEGSDVILCPVDGITTGGYSWMLDYRIDGAFLIVSTSENHLVITCDIDTSSLENAKLTMRKFTGEDNQLWRFDGGYIESTMLEGYVISSHPNSQGSLVLRIKDDRSERQLFEHKVRWYYFASNMHTSCVAESCIYFLCFISVNVKISPSLHSVLNNASMENTTKLKVKSIALNRLCWFNLNGDFTCYDETVHA